MRNEFDQNMGECRANVDRSELINLGPMLSSFARIRPNLDRVRVSSVSSQSLGGAPSRLRAQSFLPGSPVEVELGLQTPPGFTRSYMDLLLQLCPSTCGVCAPSAPEACDDIPGYLDEVGSSCAAWVGYSCTKMYSGYTRAGMLGVQAACPRSSERFGRVSSIRLGAAAMESGGASGPADAAACRKP